MCPCHSLSNVVALKPAAAKSCDSRSAAGVSAAAHTVTAIFPSLLSTGLLLVCPACAGAVSANDNSESNVRVTLYTSRSGLSAARRVTTIFSSLLPAGSLLICPACAAAVSANSEINVRVALCNSSAGVSAAALTVTAIFSSLLSTRSLLVCPACAAAVSVNDNSVINVRTALYNLSDLMSSSFSRSPVLILFTRTLQQILCDSALLHLEREVLELSLALDPQHRRVTRFELSYG